MCHTKVLSFHVCMPVFVKYTCHTYLHQVPCEVMNEVANNGNIFPYVGASSNQPDSTASQTENTTPLWDWL